MAELVDALDSKSSSARSIGSIPIRATINKQTPFWVFFYLRIDEDGIEHRFGADS